MKLCIEKLYFTSAKLSDYDVQIYDNVTHVKSMSPTDDTHSKSCLFAYCFDSTAQFALNSAENVLNSCSWAQEVGSGN